MDGEWHPMDTVPIDGSRVEVRYANGAHAVFDYFEGPFLNGERAAWTVGLIAPHEASPPPRGCPIVEWRPLSEELCAKYPLKVWRADPSDTRPAKFVSDGKHQVRGCLVYNHPPPERPAEVTTALSWHSRIFRKVAAILAPLG
jgi:hypothetical protein